VCVISATAAKRLYQMGDGHFSPVGGYHAAYDLVRILDTVSAAAVDHLVICAEVAAEASCSCCSSAWSCRFVCVLGCVGACDVSCSRNTFVSDG
jgi:hypothetical protein